jgi:hypothetical protein
VKAWRLRGPGATPTLTASAKGSGTLTVGREEFQIYTVVVQLKENSEAQLTLVSDITLFVSGQWSVGDDLDKGINLKITGAEVSGGMHFCWSVVSAIARYSIPNPAGVPA